ncbi:type II toxin-antitoxin system VapC family toxin [bacterium AH-315-K03]|nr:type II toxin-antitoxin system VapC family toxin [bacterium AH-315-K03]
MILLDTSILSELMRSTPAPEVKNWLLQKTNDDVLVTTAITISEIEYGISRLPEGRRRKDLEDRFAAMTGPRFEFAVLPLDEAAGRLAGRLRSKRESRGLDAGSADMMIAAITALADAKLATRNVKDFTGTGIEVINPWGISK